MQRNQQPEMRVPVRITDLHHKNMNLNTTINQLLILFLLRYQSWHFAVMLLCLLVFVVVCFLSDRDWLRETVIQWIQEEVESDNLASNVSSAHDLLQTYFQVRPRHVLLVTVFCTLWRSNPNCINWVRYSTGKCLKYFLLNSVFVCYRRMIMEIHSLTPKSFWASWNTMKLHSTSHTPTLWRLTCCWGVNWRFHMFIWQNKTKKVDIQWINRL